MLEYAQNYPKAIKTLSNMIGYEIDHTTEGYLEFGRQIPVLCLSTREKKDQK